MPDHPKSKAAVSNPASTIQTDELLAEYQRSAISRRADDVIFQTRKKVMAQSMVIALGGSFIIS